MTETMKRTIDSLHRIPYSHVQMIPHGVPQTSLSRQRHPTHRILVSNGLIHQGKGLEYSIDAIPALLSSHPNIIYYVLGTPHPTGEGTREYYR